MDQIPLKHALSIKVTIKGEADFGGSGSPKQVAPRSGQFSQFLLSIRIEYKKFYSLLLSLIADL